MKNNVIIILLFLLWDSPIIAQNDWKKDSVLYLNAYNYIINDSINQNKEIAVSDSIVDLDRFWFSQDIKNFFIEKEKVNRYRSTKDFRWFKPYYSYYIDSLFCKKNQQSNNILFFSQIEDNMLRVDVLPCKKHVNKFDYNAVAYQNTGQIYLFIFDEEGIIKMVFSREIVYD